MISATCSIYKILILSDIILFPISIIIDSALLMIGWFRIEGSNRGVVRVVYCKVDMST